MGSDPMCMYIMEGSFCGGVVLATFCVSLIKFYFGGRKR